MNLEALLTSPAAFNLTTATPLQRAICRAAEGLPVGLPDEDIQKHFGTAPILRPDLVVLVCGVRSGKSLMAVCAALYSALTADLSKLLSHERARAVIVAPTIANAETTFRLLTGAINMSRALKALLVGEAKNDSLTIKRKDGRLVDIIVVASHKGGVALRGTWLTGYVLEETAFFGTEATGYVVNAEELLRAAATRLVPNGQGWVISSPMGPQGLLYDLWRTHFGKPGQVLVVHAPTLAMNSVTVNIKAVEEIRKRDPDAAAREYDALWADADLVLIPAQHIVAAQRSLLAVPWVEGQSYVAAMDPATRGNAWALAIATKQAKKPIHQVVCIKEWIGAKTRPLDPDATLADIAQTLSEYRIHTVFTDQLAADFIKVIGRRHGVVIYDIAATQGENVELFTSMQAKFADGEIEIPDDEHLRADLQGIRKKVSSRISITLAKTPDGRHCDYAPTIARVVSLECQPPQPVMPKEGTPEWSAWQHQLQRQNAMMEAARRVKIEDKDFAKAVKHHNFRRIRDYLGR